MPAKRARTNTRAAASSSTSRSFDRSRFLSAIKEEFYRSHLAHKECVKEWGVLYREGRRDLLGLQEAMEIRRWKNWVNPIQFACEVMVREFYANTYCDNQEDRSRPPVNSSWFRGDVIDYNPVVIRRHLGLLTEDQEKEFFPEKATYHELLKEKSPEILEDMKAVIVRPGRDWEAVDDEIIFVRRKDMTPQARVWAEFLQDSLIPSSNKSEVREVTMVVIYCIVRGHPMDVATIISGQIYSLYNGSKEKHRPIFPHLICSLILAVRDKARRPVHVIEKRLPVAPILSKDRITQLYQEWTARMPQEEEEEEDPEEPAEEEDEEEEEEEEEEENVEVVNEVVTPPRADPSPAWMEAAFGRMFLRQDRLHRDLDLHWRGGSTSDPRSNGPMDFNTLEQGMIGLSLMHDAGVHPDYGDGRGEHDPMV
ncbi:uncharacterized protein LOC130737823 [Lotus japonicus]|uniref:uncharacterized protein LOC130737823 n=1 Tax=Lotus japonicus TaxID=34305 RepID=UPI00258B6B72|nr:uncharacterized protein LOC130737823 [Lotus japonicus]